MHPNVKFFNFQIKILKKQKLWVENKEKRCCYRSESVPDFTANQYMPERACDLYKNSLSLAPNFKLEDNKVGQKFRRP